MRSYLIKSSFRFDDNHKYFFFFLLSQPKIYVAINLLARPGSNKKMINVCCVSASPWSRSLPPDRGIGSHTHVSVFSSFFLLRFTSFSVHASLAVCLSVARNSIVQVINYTYKIIRLKAPRKRETKMKYETEPNGAHLDRQFMHGAKIEHRKLASARIRHTWAHGTWSHGMEFQRSPAPSTPVLSYTMALPLPDVQCPSAPMWVHNFF